MVWDLDNLPLVNLALGMRKHTQFNKRKLRLVDAGFISVKTRIIIQSLLRYSFNE